MMSEGVPMPSPSSAPEEVTDTAETMKPALMMRSAVAPASMVAGSSANSPISHFGAARNSAVPTTMMQALIRSTRS